MKNAMFLVMGLMVISIQVFADSDSLSLLGPSREKRVSSLLESVLGKKPRSMTVDQVVRNTRGQIESFRVVGSSDSGYYAILECNVAPSESSDSEVCSITSNIPDFH